MKLHSKRLLAIAKAIAQHKQGTILADIGTDHAYLPCFLYDQGVIEKAYACDVAEGPLASSKQTIIANHMEGKIIPLLGNGLDPIVNEDVDMISICGMGGMLMIEILDAHNEMHNHRFFLQANNGLAELRAYLAMNIWLWKKEKWLLMKMIFSLVLLTVKRKQNYLERNGSLN